VLYCLVPVSCAASWLISLRRWSPGPALLAYLLFSSFSFPLSPIEKFPGVWVRLAAASRHISTTRVPCGLGSRLGVKTTQGPDSIVRARRNTADQLVPRVYLASGPAVSTNTDPILLAPSQIHTESRSKPAPLKQRCLAADECRPNAVCRRAPIARARLLHDRRDPKDNNHRRPRRAPLADIRQDLLQ
jgi:hypothetical protein